MKIIGGYTNYGQDIGILMLDTRFPRIIGDIGNANTFHTHVRYRTVRNITKGPITEKNIEKELLFPFLEAAKSLEAEGCKAITTSCSFLAGYQQRLADAVHIPVFTSTLLLVPMLRAMLNRHSTIGIFTENPQVLNEEYFLQAGWSSKDIPVAVTGMQSDSPFSNLFIGDHVEEDLGTLKECVEELTLRHMREHPGTGAIVLECTNLAPFTGLIQKLAGVPVFGLNQLLEYIESCINPPEYC